MAKPEAKKSRNKQVREGKCNPELNRSRFALMDLNTRRTKSKKDYLYREKHKNPPFQDGNDGSFYIMAVLKLNVYF